MSQMKRGLLVVLIGLFLVCGMVGCGGSKATEGSKTTTKTEMKTQPQAQPKPWGEETRENLMKGAGSN